MKMVVRKFQGPDRFDQMKAEEYRYWQSVSPTERVLTGHQLSIQAYEAYGSPADGQQLKRVAVRSERSWS